MRRMPQARGHKARYREEAFYELEKVAKQRFNDGNVKLEMKASYIGSKIFEADHLYKSFGDLKIWTISLISLPDTRRWELWETTVRENPPLSRF